MHVSESEGSLPPSSVELDGTDPVDFHVPKIKVTSMTTLEGRWSRDSRLRILFNATWQVHVVFKGKWALLVLEVGDTNVMIHSFQSEAHPSGQLWHRMA